MIRGLVATGLIALAVSGLIGNAMSLIVATVAVVFLVTGASGVCPMYSVLRRAGPRAVR